MQEALFVHTIIQYIQFNYTIFLDGLVVLVTCTTYNNSLPIFDKMNKAFFQLYKISPLPSFPHIRWGKIITVSLVSIYTIRLSQKPLVPQLVRELILANRQSFQSSRVLYTEIISHYLHVQNSVTKLFCFRIFFQTNSVSCAGILHMKIC